MNTHTLSSQSSLSRIWILSKISFFSTLRSLLYFYAIIAICFIGLPLLFNMISTGSFVEAFQELAGTYRYGGLSSLFASASAFYLLAWISRIVHLPTPGAYTQIPASTTEKMLSMALMMIGYLLLATILASALTLLLSLGQKVSLGGEWKLLFGLLSEASGHWILAFNLASLAPFFAVALCMIHFKKPTVGILVAFSTFYLLANVAFVGVMELIDHPELLQRLSSLSETTISYLLSGIFFVLDVALVFALHWRLRTLQIK